MNQSKAILTLAVQPARSSRPRHWATALLLALLALAPLLLNDAFYTHLAIFICLNAILVSGLSLLARAGQVSLCHGAFAGLGAYISVAVVMGAGLPFALGLVGAVVASAACAWLLGSIVLRLRGVYFVLVTFAFGELVRLCLLEWDGITGGANGIAGIAAASLFGVSFASKASFYGLALAITVALFALLALLYRSPAGHAIDAVGENANLAEASGLGVLKTQRYAFTLGSAIAGLGGALTAHYLGYISPESFNMHLSVALIIMMVVGGRAYWLGPLIGALVMTPLPELFRGAVQSQNMFYGAALILMLRFLPQGLASLGRLGRRQGDQA